MGLARAGTLTLNKMVLQEVEAYAPGAQPLELAALATRWKEPAKDALDTLVLNAAVRPKATEAHCLRHQRPPACAHRMASQDLSDPSS